MKMVRFAFLLICVLCSGVLVRTQLDEDAINQIMVLTKHLRDIFTAASEGDSAEVIRLLEKSSRNPNWSVNRQGTYQGKVGYTILHVAAEAGHEDVVTTLMSKGANINAQDGTNFTSLMAAVNAGNQDMVKLLVDLGADANIPGPRQLTCLLLAARGGNLEIVKILVEGALAQMDAVNDEGYSAMMMAAARGHSDIVEYLVVKGAHVNVMDSSQNSALSWAVYSKNADIVSFLLERGAAFDNFNEYGMSCVLLASALESVKSLKALLEKGADVNAVVWKDNKSALHFAAEKGSTAVARILIDNGIDLDIEWEEGIEKIKKTAAQVAEENFKHEVVKMIEERKRLLSSKNLKRNVKMIDHDSSEL